LSTNLDQYLSMEDEEVAFRVRGRARGLRSCLGIKVCALGFRV